MTGRHTLHVAAGGGGDVLAALLVAEERPVIASWAWERLLVDPLPGPRGWSDFDRLDEPVAGVRVVTPDSVPRSPAGSLLPALAAVLDATIVLLDPEHGAVGLTRQIAAAAAWCGGGIRIVDVGGDILGRPGDPGLRSPLADVTSLVAATQADATAELVVVGPGADGELPPELVTARLRQLGATRLDAVAGSRVAAMLPILAWHPSEATAVVAAAALGYEGLVEIRDRGLPVVLGPELAGTWAMPAVAALPEPSIADTISCTRTLAELRSQFRNVYQVDEIGYETDKAARLDGNPATAPLTDPEALEHVLRAAARRGARWCTRRRIQEALRPAALTPADLERLLAERWVPPLVATSGSLL